MAEGKYKDCKYNWEEPDFKKICGWRKQQKKKSIWKMLYSLFF